MKREPINCHACSELTRRPIFHGVDPYCWYCYRELVECDSCGNYFAKEEITRSDQGDFCEDCTS